MPFILGDGAMDALPALARLFHEIEARPAAKAARALPTTHAFKTEFDEAAMRNMYPQIFAPD